MHEVLVNRSGGLSLPRKSVVRLTDRPNMTLDVYRGRKTTVQQQQQQQLQLTHDLTSFPCDVGAPTTYLVQRLPFGLVAPCLILARDELLFNILETVKSRHLSVIYVNLYF